MANKVLLKKSSVVSKVPLTTDLDYGELALNYADGKLYFKNSSNVISSFSTAASSGTSVSIGTAAPVSPTAGDLWWDSTYGSLKIYYNDGDTSQWVDSQTSSAGSGTVTSVDMTVPVGLSISGNPITSSGTLVLSLTAGYSIPTTTSQTNWDSAYTQRLQWDGGSTNLVAATGRTSLGATTVGGSLFTLTNPSAITFPRFNADNTVSALDAASFRTAIGAGTSSTVGTVISVGGTGTVAGLSLSGTVTSSGNLTLSGTLSTPVSTINDSTTVGQNLVKLTNPSAITFPRFNADNTVSTLDAATFRTAIGAGDMSITVYDTNSDGTVDSADFATEAGSVPWSGITSTPTTFPPEAHTQAISTITGLQTALDGKQPTGSYETTGTAASLVTAHEALTNPHPQYATPNSIALITGDMMGFIDRTSTALSFVDATRTFTITPTGSTWSIYYRGNIVTVTGARSVVIPNTSGAYFVRLNTTTLELEAYTGSPDFANNITMAYIYWSVSASKAIIVGDERHTSIRDTTWHSNQHLNVGTVWRSGGSLAYTLNNASAINLAVGTPLLIADEDLLHTINNSATPTADFEQILSTSASLQVMYLNGTEYVTTTASTTPFVAGTSTARYNLITGGSGSLVDAGEGKYITYWLLATNDIRSPVKLVMGRTPWNTIDEAYSEDFTEYGLNLAEQVFMYQIVLQTSTAYTANAARVVIVAVRKILTKASSGVSAYTASSHAALTDRDSVDQHPIAAITGLQTALDGKQASGSYAPTTSGTSILYGNASGGFSNATVGDKLSFSAGILDYAGPRITVGTSAPISPAVGDLWVDTN